MSGVELSRENIMGYLNSVSGIIYKGRMFDELTNKEKYVTFFSILTRRDSEDLSDDVVSQLKCELFGVR